MFLFIFNSVFMFQAYSGKTGHKVEKIHRATFKHHFLLWFTTRSYLAKPVSMFLGGGRKPINLKGTHKGMNANADRSSAMPDNYLHSLAPCKKNKNSRNNM